MQIKEHCMQSNCNVNLKLVLIVLSLISSISSLYLPSNMVHTPLSFNKYAFAERNPVLPNSEGIIKLLTSLNCMIIEPIQIRTRSNPRLLFIISLSHLPYCITQAIPIAQVRMVFRLRQQQWLT